jgi:hypothetical protein
VALWDFVQREPGPDGRFCAIQPKRSPWDFCLDPLNYVRDFWGAGRVATLADFPVANRGPFGAAVRLRQESDPDFRPLLQVPRGRLAGSPLDVKGPGRSVSMVAWIIRESGNHAVAGIWHEGTDLKQPGAAVTKVERGQRQYALFAGLAAKNGASAVHVSENGASSFGDKYARHLAVTPELLATVAAGAPEETPDASWSVMGFSFDNKRNTVTAYLNGKATEYWVDDLPRHPFFQWPYRAWTQAQLRKMPGLQPGEDPDFPASQFYEPPEQKPLWRQAISETEDMRVELHGFAFTKVRVTMARDSKGRFTAVKNRELIALRVNPFWFPHDLYSPPGGQGGPFTIGRVIHTSRSVGFTGWIGGVAVFDRALNERQMQRLAEIRRPLSR